MTVWRQEAPPSSPPALQPWPLGHDLAQLWASDHLRPWKQRLRVLSWGLVTAGCLLVTGLGQHSLPWVPTSQQMTVLVWALSVVPIGLWVFVLSSLVLSPRLAYRPKRSWGTQRSRPPHYRPLAFHQEHAFILLITSLWVWPVITGLVLVSGLLTQPAWGETLTRVSIWVCFGLQIVGAAFAKFFTVEHDPKDSAISWGGPEWAALWRTIAELWLRICCAAAPLLPLRMVWRTTLTLLAAGRPPEQIPAQVLDRLHRGSRLYWKILLRHEERSIRQWAIQEMGAAAARAPGSSSER